MRLNCDLSRLGHAAARRADGFDGRREAKTERSVVDKKDDEGQTDAQWCGRVAGLEYLHIDDKGVGPPPPHILFPFLFAFSASKRPYHVHTEQCRIGASAWLEPLVSLLADAK